MFFLQASNPGVSFVLFIGTIGMLVLTIGLVLFIIFHQRKVARYQQTLQRMEQEQQKILLNASIKLQEEERQRPPRERGDHDRLDDPVEEGDGDHRASLQARTTLRYADVPIPVSALGDWALRNQA